MIPGSYINEKEKIQNEIQRLEKEVRQLQEQHRAPALKAIVAAMREYDISLEEVASASGARTTTGRSAQPRPSVPAKYRDPASGQTWSGRGRTPRWMKTAEEQGHKRDDFLITRD